MAELGVKRVTRLEWIGIGAGLLTLIVSFFPWFSASALVADVEVARSSTAWGAGIAAWLSVLMLLATAVLIALRHVGVAVPHLALIWLGLSTAGAVMILLRWLTLPDDGELRDVGLDLVQVEGEAGAGVGLIIGLVLAIASTAVALWQYRSAPRPPA